MSDDIKVNRDSNIDSDFTSYGEIEVYMGCDDDFEKLERPLQDLMTRVWEAGGGYKYDCIRVKVRVEYIPEDK